jgi:AAA domain/Bifunctional DNA primase/polymerase, N-terminal
MSRHSRMVNAAVWLCEQGAHIGWGSASDGKAVKRKWKSDATSDPALVPGLLGGAKNALIIAAGRLVIIDLDREGGLTRLREAGLPETFMVATPSGPDRLHVYGLAPEGYDVTALPGTYADGEVRRSVGGEQSMVLGPWSLRSDGEYKPLDDAPRVLAEFPESVLEYIKTHPAKKPPVGATNGRDEGEWLWDESYGSRHDYLRDRIRYWRGVGITGDALFAMTVDHIEKHAIPRYDGQRLIDDAELRRMVEGADRKFTDDPPPVRLDLSPEKVEERVKELEAHLPPVVNGATAQRPADIDDWLVEDLLRPKTLAVLASTEGVGKSNMRLELGVRFACGEGALFDTYPMAKAGMVLLFDEENGEREEWEREEAMLDSLNLTRDPHLLLYNRVSHLGLNLEDPAHRVLFDQMLTDYDPSLVILDTAGSMVGEEHGKDFKTTIAFLKQMKEQHDCCILLVVHLVKPPRDGNTKGRSIERSITDVMGQWTRPADVVMLVSETDDDDVILFRVRKRVPRSDITLKRDDPGAPNRWLRVDAKRMPPTVVTKADHANILLAVEAGRGTWQQVTGFLSGQGLPVPSRAQMFRHLRDLSDHGLIERDANGVIVLTDAGRAALPARVSLHLVSPASLSLTVPPTGGSETDETGTETDVRLDETHEENTLRLE